MSFKITEKTFRESINRVASTDDGKVLFAWLASYCFHNGSPLDKESLQKTYANAAVQNVYRAMRSFINAEHLRDIEYNYKIITKEEETKDADK